MEKENIKRNRATETEQPTDTRGQEGALPGHDSVRLATHSIQKHPPDTRINFWVMTSATFYGDLIYQLISSDVQALEFVLEGL